jgi:2-iminobutanoate/2-iminopropanoate deaminase
MEMTVIQTRTAPAAIGPYSQGILCGSMLFVSGQIGIHPETGELVSPDLLAQARQAIENMHQILRAAGADLKQVTAVDVYLTDIPRFSEFNAVYQEYFTDHKPARAVIEVSGLPKGAKVEIKCIAVL